MKRTINNIPDFEEMPMQERLTGYLEQNANVEVLSGRYRSVTDFADIDPLTIPTKSHRSSVSQVLLQVITAGGESFGVIAARGQSGAALLLARLGDGTERAELVGAINTDEALVVGRTHTNVQGRPLSPDLSRQHFSVAVVGGAIRVNDLNSFNGTDVYTRLKPDAAKHERGFNKETFDRLRQRMEALEAHSDFAAALPNPFANIPVWAPESAKVEALL